MSKLTLDAAATLVTRAVRYHGHLSSLQKRCRQKIRRYIWKTEYPLAPRFAAPHQPDPVIYYYINTVSEMRGK